MTQISHQLTDITTTLDNLSRSIETRKLHSASLLARSGKYIQACRHIENQMFTEPRQRIEATLLLAKVFAQQGAFDKAVACWNQALEADSGCQEAILGLAAVSRRSMNPALFRLLGCIAGCFLVLFLAVGLGVYLNYQAQHLALRIASVESNNRELAIDQTRKIDARIGALHDAYSRGMAESSAQVDVLKKKIDLADEQNKQRDHMFGDRLDVTLTGIRTERMKNQQALFSRLATIESALAEQKTVLVRKIEEDTTRLSDRLDGVTSAFNTLEKTNKNPLAKDISAGSSYEAINVRLQSIEQQVVEIRAMLGSTDSPAQQKNGTR